MQVNELQIYVVYIKQGVKRFLKIHETQHNSQTDICLLQYPNPNLTCGISW